MQVISHKVYEGYELDATTFLVEFWGLTTAAPEGIDPDDWPHASYVDEYLLTECTVLEAWEWAKARMEPGETYALYLPLHVEGSHANIDRASAFRGADRRWTDVGRIRLLGQDQAGPGRSFHRPWDERLDADSLPGRPFAVNDPVH